MDAGQTGTSSIEGKRSYLDLLMNPNLTWVEIAQLCEQLLCSEKVIYAAKRLDVLKAGKHFYALGNISKGGKHIYCVELCRQALLDQTAKQAKAESEKIKTQEVYNQSHLKELATPSKIWRPAQNESK